MNPSHRLYKHNDILYKIIREIPSHNFENMDIVKEFRDYIGADHVLQNQSHFLFCETIQDAEIIE
jgi:hypothetical protein